MKQPSTRIKGNRLETMDVQVGTKLPYGAYNMHKHSQGKTRGRAINHLAPYTHCIHYFVVIVEAHLLIQLGPCFTIQWL